MNLFVALIFITLAVFAGIYAYIQRSNNLKKKLAQNPPLTPSLAENEKFDKKEKAVKDLVSEGLRVEVENPELTVSEKVKSEVNQITQEKLLEHMPEVQTEGTSEKIELAISWAERLKRSLAKTQNNILGRIKTALSGNNVKREEIKEQIEEILYTSDIGPQTVVKLLSRMDEKLAAQEQMNYETVQNFLKIEILNILKPLQVEFNYSTGKADEPFVVMVIGVNGAGKTTSIGKIANFYKNKGNKILLAAGDTFRAAAVAQLKVWGERNQVEVIAQKEGVDPSSVLFDAVQAAKARHVDLCLADTAGRLHTKSNLMEELKKSKRVMEKIIASAPHEVLLVIDASMGQNALIQAREFHKSLGVTGLVLTKLDGTAKGGVLLGIADELKIPIRFIGIGEGINDLQTFNAQEFVDAFFSESIN